MLTFKSLLNSFKENTKLADIFGCLPFQWNDKSGRFRLKSARKRIFLKRRLFLLALFSFLVVIQILWTWDNTKKFVNLHSIFHVCALLLFPYSHVVFWLKADLIVSYLNGMLLFENFEKGRIRKPVSNSRDGTLIKAIIRICGFSCLVVPVLFHLELIRNPCLPTYLGGYWLVYSQCKGQIGTDFRATWSVTEILCKLLVVSCNYFKWSFLVSGTYYHVMLAILLKTYCLRSYILIAGEKIGNNFLKDWESKSRACLIYRGVEVMSTEYRRLYSCYMTASVLLLVAFEHTLSLFACLNFGLRLPLSMFFFFTLVALNCGLVLIYMYTGLANVFTASKYVLEVQLSRVNTGCRWYRRFLKSCKLVKVYIGTTNFVEPLTPLTVERFSVDQTVSLMLVE